MVFLYFEKEYCCNGPADVSRPIATMRPQE
jgi:hypothetical protein